MCVARRFFADAFSPSRRTCRIIVRPLLNHVRERIRSRFAERKSRGQVRSLVRIVRSAKSEVAGIACVVEKTFEGGRAALEHYNVPIVALATITSMEDGQIVFADERITSR